MKVPKGAKFVELKEKYLADELAEFRKQSGRKTDKT